MVDNKESSQSPGEYQKLQSEGRYRVGADIPTIPFSEIGKRGVRRVDGYEKASGKAVYTRDVNFQGMLHARVLTSPHARARIISMDTSEAERLPGVRAIIRYDDPEVEGRILNGSYFGPDWVFPDLVGWALKPERPVLGSETWYHGQPVG